MFFKRAVPIAVVLAMSSGVFAANLSSDKVRDFAAKNPDYFKVDPQATRITQIFVGKPKKVKSFRIKQQPMPNVPNGAYGIPATPVTPAPAVDPNNPGGYPVTPAYPAYPADPSIPGQEDAIGTAERIINLAEKIFKIVADNKPVVNVTVNYANAVPKGMAHWTDLSGWEMPKAYGYEFVMKNVYGLRTVGMKYQVIFTYGGNMDGKGKYLTGVTVQPISLDVAWAYNVNVRCEIPDSTIVNVGTKENPIAAMQVVMFISVDTIVAHREYRDIFYVRGDGQFTSQPDSN
ncbi:MAG: hypothetical protein WCS77_08940 [Elusimicrobiaceae bacterium]